MRVLLINPPLLEDFTSTSCYPPLGLASLASFLEKNNIEVQILDTPAELMSLEKCGKRVLSLSPDLVGITAMTPTYPQALKMAKLIKKQEKIPICIGGPHATFLPESVLSDVLITL